MRPPSYYASIVKSNTGHSSPYASSYGSSSATDYSATPRTSSRELRSSLSSPSSSSYVSRSHLPFVPQSTLVAHCIAGVGSSTRPYGSSTPASPSYSSRTASSYSSASSSSASSSASYASLRPPSGKRASQYLSSSSSGYSSAGSRAASSSRYLSPASAASSRHSRPTASTTSTSSYYKPIRLRERPLLTQISRQINSARPARPSQRSAGPSHSSASETTETKSERLEGARAELSVSVRDGQESRCAGGQNESADWSSDVGRNISRNKYLIKFREFDKRARPSVDVEATIQLPASEHSERDSGVPDRDTPTPGASVTVEHTMRLPTPEPPRAPPAHADVSRSGATGEMGQECDKRASEGATAEEGAPTCGASVGAKKERKNVKLRLKPIGTGGGGGAPLAGKKKKSEPSVEATPAATVTDATVVSAPPTTELRPLKAKEPAPREATKRNKQEPQPALESAPAKPAAKAVVEKAEASKSSVARDRDQEKLFGGNKENEASEPVREPAEPGPAVTKAARANQATTATKARRGSKPVVDDHQGPAGSGDQKPKSRVVKTKKKKRPEEEAEPTSGKANGASRKATSQRGRSAAVDEKAKQPQSELASPAAPISGPKKAASRIRFREYNIGDFNFLTVLGHGGWGFVILAELKEHDACFAVKCIKKITIVEDDDYDSIMIERKMLTLGNVHPFICKLFCTFETPGYLFFVMEYCAGGDLMFHVQHEGKFSESRCRFYAAEIICAIRFLHNRHIIYRDLKLDNILLDASGHIRLVDFGMCQCRTYREEMLPSNFCGTPEYISPEIIKGVPYNHSVDWWSFGVLLYEMAVGKMPFRGNDENELLWNVCYEQIHYPMFLTKELTSLLKSLLEREPSKRMGMATCKAGDIYDQPFFRAVDWKAVEELRVEPPFVPEVKSNRDVSNFDSDFTESTCELSPVDEATLSRIDQKQFEKFPYTNPDIFIFDPAQQAGQRPTSIF